MDAKRILTLFVLLVSVVCEVSTQSRPTCPLKDQVLHSNKRCCQYVQCKPQHYVKVCETEGGADVCVPCGPTAYLDDSTDSHFVFECLEKNCGEDTEPIDFPATKFDGSACSKRCRCNLAKNYCGTDPCRCQYTLCSQWETLLQNCTCVRKQKEVLPTPPVTAEEVRVSEPPPVNPTGQSSSDVTNSNTDSVDVEERENGSNSKTRIVVPDFIDVPGREPKPEDSYHWWIPGLVAAAFVIVGFVVIGIVYWRPGRRNNVTYSDINVNHNSTVHNYHKCNVQIGNKNILIRRASESESESACSKDED